MAAAALLAESPISGKLIAVELIEELASHYQLSDQKEAALLFIRKYAGDIITRISDVNGSVWH